MYNENYWRIVLRDLMIMFEVDEMEYREEKCTPIINSYENCMRVSRISNVMEHIMGSNDESCAARKED